MIVGLPETTQLHQLERQHAHAQHQDQEKNAIGHLSTGTFPLAIDFASVIDPIPFDPVEYIRKPASRLAATAVPSIIIYRSGDKRRSERRR